MRVDRIGQILPDAANAGHIRLPAEFAFRADFLRHAGDFRSEAAELVDHRVDRVLQLENFAARIDRDLAGQVASGNGRRHLRDVADLRGQVAGHEVDASR